MNLKRWAGDRVVNIFLPFAGLIWRRIWREPHKVVKTIHKYFGIDGLAIALRLLPDGTLKCALQTGGASVGEGVALHGPLTIINFEADFSGLRIEGGVHIGSGVLIDLAAPVQIGENATVSMRCILLTHQDVGNAAPQGKEMPRKTAALFVGDASYIGAGATVLCGASIGKRGLVAAGAVVTVPVPEDSKVVGVPAAGQHGGQDNA